VSKETYYKAKETYYEAKETYYKAKETYYKAKETYYEAKETNLLPCLEFAKDLDFRFRLNSAVYTYYRHIVYMELHRRKPKTLTSVSV